MSRWSEQWFGKGQAVLITEKLFLDDGRVVKRGLVKKDPTIKYFVTAPEFREEHSLPEEFYPLEKCEAVESSVERIDKEIAAETGQMTFYEESRGPGAARRRRKLHEHRWLHGSDADVTDHYIDRYLELYKDSLDNIAPLDMAFGDTEVDPTGYSGFPDEFDAPCPLTVMTYVFRGVLTIDMTRHMVEPNPQIAEFEAEAEMRRRWILAEVNRAPAEKAGLVPKGAPWEELLAKLEEPGSPLRVRDVALNFYDSEIEMILAYLERIVSVDKPDTMAFWNACFDLNTIMGRLRRHNMDPARAFTSPDFRDWPYAQYNLDTFNTQETDKSDHFLAANLTIWIDQMLLYASLRKQAGKKPSYSLDFTLREEIKEHKHDLRWGIREAPYKDYANYVLYAALDTVPMAELERKTDDITLAYSISMLTRSRFHKVMKKTVCLRNLANVFMRERGLAISNNRNRTKERVETEKFLGGFVANPDLMDYTGILLGGSPSNRVFDDAVDFDAKSLYPSIIMMCNIDAAGQIGRLMLYGPGGEPAESSEFVEAVASGDCSEIGRRWLGLPGVGEAAAEVLGAEEFRPGADAAAPPPEDYDGEELAESNPEEEEE
jgi:hypothetical protein